MSQPRELLSIGGAKVIVLADEPAVALEAVQRTVDALAAAIARRGEAHLALTGGSSAVSLHHELSLSKWHAAVEWEKVHLWWGDERFVPTDHPESNAGLAYRTLLAVSAWAGESGSGASGSDVEAGAVPALPVLPGNVHPVEVEETIGDSEPALLAAQLYAADMERLLPKGPGGTPAFDVMLSGIGPDGHTMSIFPGSPALKPDAPIAMAVPAPQHVEPHLARVTLSARMLAAAGLVIMMAAGSAKAEVLAQVLGADRDPSLWPAQAALLPNAVWLLDEAVAAKLR